MFQIEVVQSRRNIFFIAVSTLGLHSSNVLNVIYKNCKYLHADEDIHRNSYAYLVIIYLFSSSPVIMLSISHFQCSAHTRLILSLQVIVWFVSTLSQRYEA